MVEKSKGEGPEILKMAISNDFTIQYNPKANMVMISVTARLSQNETPDASLLRSLYIQASADVAMSLLALLESTRAKFALPLPDGKIVPVSKQ